MKLKLVDNAVDSIQITMDLFRKHIYCLDKYKNRYLKMTIIYLHNSIELLFKALLIQKDEMLIYKDRTKVTMEKAKAEVVLDGSISLDEYLIKNLNVQTITYSELIDEYVKHFHCSEKACNVIKLLGKYRNAVTHFGIDKDDDVDKIFNVIYETFGFILYELYDEIVNIHDYFEYNDVIDNLESWYEAGITVQQELCCKNPNRKIKQSAYMLKNVVNSSKFKNFIGEKHIQIDEGYTNYDNNDIYLKFSNASNLYVEIHTSYKPYYNLTFFEDYYGYVLFVVDHYNEIIYFFNEEVEDESYYFDELKLIEEQINKGNCIKKPLTENNMRNKIIEKVKLELIM